MMMRKPTPLFARQAGFARNGVRRHIIGVCLAAALVAVFAQVHGQWSAMHKWNRAVGDASVMLIALSFAIGPLSRLFRPLTRLIPFRREFGIYACILAGVHTVIILVGWVEFDLMRLFGFEWHAELQTYVMFQHGFGLGNAIGIAALVLVFLLAVTSSDLAMRKLGTSGWKFIQMGVLPLWWLTIAHVAYFLYAHFLSFHRDTPDPNPLQIPFAILVVSVLALRIASYVITVRNQKRRAGGAQRGNAVPVD
jgi:sulfoxide reductase heme-binding subunit YedZ